MKFHRDAGDREFQYLEALSIYCSRRTIWTSELIFDGIMYLEYKTAVHAIT